jgi:hypothetical protein
MISCLHGINGLEDSRPAGDTQCNLQNVVVVILFDLHLYDSTICYRYRSFTDMPRQIWVLWVCQYGTHLIVYFVNVPQNEKNAE